MLGWVYRDGMLKEKEKQTNPAPNQKTLFACKQHIWMEKQQKDNMESHYIILVTF